jgi:type II restriction enzyme
VPPFNTAIVKGYNAVTGAKVKLGSWDHFLAMRAGILDLNDRYRELLSNDLGAIGGLLFDIGSGRYPAPPLEDDATAADDWLGRLEHARAEASRLDKTAAAQGETDRTHAEIQAWLRDLGHALGYDVWIAANDRGRLHAGCPLGQGCLERLPDAIATSPGADSIRLIDVLWLAKGGDGVAAAFEVEHSTSIYSGIVRMLDLALSGSDLHAAAGLFLVAPNAREQDVRAQLRRPAFSRIADLDFAYLPYGELERNRDAIARFGTGLKAIKAISSPPSLKGGVCGGGGILRQARPDSRREILLVAAFYGRARKATAQFYPAMATHFEGVWPNAPILNEAERTPKSLCRFIRFQHGQPNLCGTSRSGPAFDRRVN